MKVEDYIAKEIMIHKQNLGTGINKLQFNHFNTWKSQEKVINNRSNKDQKKKEVYSNNLQLMKTNQLKDNIYLEELVIFMLTIIKQTKIRFGTQESIKA